MERVDYLRAFRRRWGIIAIAVVIALGAGYASRSLVKSHTPAPKRYTATAYILGSSDPNATNLATYAALTTFGQVPVKAAKTLAWTRSPSALVAKVEVNFDQSSGLMWISDTSGSPSRAQVIANVFAKSLVQYLGSRKSNGAILQATRVKAQMSTLGKEISSINSQLAVSSGPQATLLSAQRDSKVSEYGVLSDQYEQLLVSSSSASAPISIIQFAHAKVESGGGSGVSLPLRLVVAALLGLLAGAGLVLVLERFDQRIQTKREAERSFGLPVLGEIPLLSRRDRQSVSIEKLQPFRLLGAVVASTSSHAEGNGKHPDPRTILVTSGTQSEGKTTVVGYLAAAFAEEGKKVIVLSCDLRRPDVHRLFELPDDAGLLKALHANRGLGALNGHAKPTQIPNVRVVASEPSPEQAGALLSSDAMRAVVRQAREEADVVLMDSTSLLKDSDPAALTAMVDGVLVVAEAGKTTSDEARSTSELLTRLGAPVVGVALNRVRNSKGGTL
jgi:capsular exopolysaccharide synthesis family protein